MCFIGTCSNNHVITSTSANTQCFSYQRSRDKLLQHRQLSLCWTLLSPVENSHWIEVINASVLRLDSLLEDYYGSSGLESVLFVALTATVKMCLYALLPTGYCQELTLKLTHTRRAWRSNSSPNWRKTRFCVMRACAGISTAQSSFLERSGLSLWKPTSFLDQYFYNSVYGKLWSKFCSACFPVVACVWLLICR